MYTYCVECVLANIAMYLAFMYCSNDTVQCITLCVTRKLYVYSFVRVSCAVMEFRENVIELFHLFGH